jgi:hypothetical protein
MPEETKEHEVREHKVEEHKRKIPLKLTRWDVIAVVILILFVIVVTIPNYVSKDDCEVARPAYKCASFKDVMIENCVYWGNYSCNTQSDVSLPQIEWYIDNMCNLQNQYHNSGLDCSSLKGACNQIVGNQTCPIDY